VPAELKLHATGAGEGDVVLASFPPHAGRAIASACSRDSSMLCAVRGGLPGHSPRRV